MGFDTKKFSNQQFEPRFKDIPVPELMDFFEEGELPVWKIRCLSGPELGYCKNSAKNDKAIDSMLGLLVSENISEKVEGLRNLFDLGVKNNRIGDIPERIHMLVQSSVDPICSLELAIKLSKVYPVVFYNLTNSILSISGKGMVQKELEKKPPAS